MKRKNTKRIEMKWNVFNIFFSSKDVKHSSNRQRGWAEMNGDSLYAWKELVNFMNHHLPSNTSNAMWFVENIIREEKKRFLLMLKVEFESTLDSRVNDWHWFYVKWIRKSCASIMTTARQRTNIQKMPKWKGIRVFKLIRLLIT